MRNFQGIVLFCLPASLGDFQSFVIILLSFQWKTTECTLFHPWWFYVIIKMLTYTYRWRFLFEVNDSYTRALIEVCSPLTRKAATGSSGEMLPLQSLWKKFPLWPKICYLKINYRQLISLICRFYYFSKILKYHLGETTSAMVVLMPVFWIINLFFLLALVLPMLIFKMKLPARKFSHYTSRISFHLVTKGLLF